MSDRLYHGVVVDVLPPGHVNNINRFQYEYLVSVDTKPRSSLLLQAARMCESGSTDNFNDTILSIGYRVLILCMNGSLAEPIIIGSLRASPIEQEQASGIYWKRRFNLIEQMIDRTGNFSIKSDSGPNLHVKTDRIILDDSAGDSITIDKSAKLLTIQCNEWKVEVKGKASISVTGDTDIKCQKNANITVTDKCVLKAAKLDATISGEVNLQAGKLNAKIDGDAKIKASSVEVDSSKIDLGKPAIGQVMTTGPGGTQLTCYVSGIPFVGSQTVKAKS